MPTITDKFNKAADGTGAYPTLATVSTTRPAGETNLTCEDLTAWATDTPVHFSTYRLGQDGTVDTTSQTDWKGIVSGNTITNLTRIAGAEDTGSLIGDIVELNPTIGWLDDLVAGLLVSHTQTGALKDGIVTSGKLAANSVTSAKIVDGTIATADLASSAVTTAKIADSNITTAKIAASAVSNAKLASKAVKTGNIDWSTIPSYNAITIGGASTAAAIQTKNAIIPLTTTKASSGSALTRNSSGQIVVGDGVSKVMLSASVYIDTVWNTTYAWCAIRKNGTVVAQTIDGSNSNGQCGLTIPPFLASVSSGDKLDLYIYAAGDAKENNKVEPKYTYLTAQGVA